MRKRIYLWKDEIPNQLNGKKKSIEEFDESSNTTKSMEVSNPLIEVFEPERNNNNGNAILICPGGSYQILAMDKEGTEPALWFNKLGYTAYLLQYRVPDNREGAFNDIQRAFKIIKNKYNHTKIGTLGFSAGGNLCARLNTNFSKNSYNLIDEIDEENCKPNFSLLIYPAYLDQGKNRSISQNLIFDKNICPTFIFGTEDDIYFNSSIVFTNYLKALKCKIELQIVPSGGHGYGLRGGNTAAETWPILAESWLNRFLKL